MTVTPEQLAATTVAVDQFTAASQQVQDAAASVIGNLWLSFTDWYDTRAVGRLAREAAALSVAQQQIIAGVSGVYVADVVSAISGTRQRTVPRSLYTPVRQGADLQVVHGRPAQVYLRAVGLGRSHEEALALAGRRAVGTLMSDLTLEERQTQQRMLDQLGIATFRRIIHPELSASGTCGLCVAASQRLYKTGELMPMHPPTCKCTVSPVIGDSDPGMILNEQDIGQLRDDAGSNKAADLKRTRYTVHEHSELGPVLTKVGDEFRDQQKARLVNDPERASRMLRQALPVLEEYRAREESGERYAAERLAYQEKFVAMLQRYAAGDVAA